MVLDRTHSERWSLTDAAMVTLALPCLMLLVLLVHASLAPEGSLDPGERLNVLAAGGVLLLVSLVVCCYVARRLGLTCCILPVLSDHNTQTEPLVPWNKSASGVTQPPSYDSIVNMDTLPISTFVNCPTNTNKNVEPGVHHINRSGSQRASREQGCYQNLRPQADNG